MKNIFLKDEKGAVLIIGVFFILLVGMALLALSIDLPMTFNKEEASQTLIRSVTSSAAKQLQFMKFGCSAKDELRKYDFISGDDVVITNNWDICPDITTKKGAVYSAKLIAYTKSHMQKLLVGKLPPRACVNVQGIMYNKYNQPYLYAYIDYPADSMFSDSRKKPNKKTGLVVCNCSSLKLTKGCYRVVSGQLFTDEAGNLENYSSKNPWQVFNNGLKTYFVVETSYNTKEKTDFHFIGGILTFIDNILGYNIGDNVKNMYSGYITFAINVSPQFLTDTFYPNLMPYYKKINVTKWAKYSPIIKDVELPQELLDDPLNKIGIPILFGKGNWNDTKYHMKRHVSFTSENSNIRKGAFGIGWCYAIRKGVKDLLRSGCDENHQKCILNLFVSEPPHYKADHKLVEDNEKGLIEQEQENGDIIECVSAKTPPLQEDEQYKCALDALKPFKEKNGIVMVIGLEGNGVVDKEKFAKWIAEASEDVDSNYLVGNRGMFLPNEDSGTVLRVNEKSINATKADVLQNLLWNFTPNTIEVCQGNSCN